MLFGDKYFLSDCAHLIQFEEKIWNCPQKGELLGNGMYFTSLSHRFCSPYVYKFVEFGNNTPARWYAILDAFTYFVVQSK